MKLVTYQILGNEAIYFGAVIQERIVSFQTLQKRKGRERQTLKDMDAYLHHLPESEAEARELTSWAEAFFSTLPQDEAQAFHNVKFLPPLPSPPALIDFALTPRHLENSLKTFLKYEYPRPLGWFLEPFIRNGMRKRTRAGILPYYKCNHLAVIGDGEETCWPDYTCYLDIEPELAFVIGKPECPVAGYTILNDWSARDVQMPEMFGTGPTRSKDFDRGYGLGPFFVTPDEIKDPLSLQVRVQIDHRTTWHGSTSGCSHHPLEVIRYLRSILTPATGTVIGMGTIPDCCGLDRDEWIRPGDSIDITFDGLGTLHQKVPQKTLDKSRSRWYKHR